MYIIEPINTFYCLTIYYILLFSEFYLINIVAKTL